MLDPCINTDCQVPGFQNRQDLGAYQIDYKTYSFYLYQATLFSKRNYSMAKFIKYNMRYIIKTKHGKQKKFRNWEVIYWNCEQVESVGRVWEEVALIDVLALYVITRTLHARTLQEEELCF